MIIDPTEKGHAARCPKCGWASKSYPVPDTAYTAAKSHKCSEASV